MKCSHRTFLVALSLLFFNSIKGQERKSLIDSLQLVVKSDSSHDTTRIKAFNDLGFQFGQSNPAEAKKYLQKAIKLAKDKEHPRGLAGAYNTLGIVHYYQRQLDSAEFNFQRALEINEELGHAFGQASALNQIGVMQMLNNKYYEAVESFEKSHEFFITINDSLSMTKAKENIGLVYSKMGNSDKAAELFYEAIKSYSSINSKADIERGYYRISSILTKQRDYAESLVFLERIEKIAVENDNQHLLHSVLHDKGWNLRLAGDYPNAMENYRLSLNIQKELGISELGYTMAGLGFTYSEMGDYKKAIENFNESLERIDAKRKDRIGDIYNGLAIAYLKLNDVQRSKMNAAQALRLANEIDNIRVKKDALDILAQIHERLGNYMTSLQFFRRYQRLQDSIFTLEGDKRVKELRAIYDTEQREKELALKTQRIDLLEEEKKVAGLKSNILWISIFSLASIAGLIIFSIRQKLKGKNLEKEKVDIELAFKKKELTSHALHLAKKNEVLESVKSKARQLKEEGTASGYQELIKTINFDQQDDRNWESFTQYFEQVHKDFAFNVKTKYPDVTKNELRFMALIKMNMSSKEIATILNISTAGVKKARYRLRKKLRIAPEESLETLIISI